MTQDNLQGPSDISAFCNVALAKEVADLKQGSFDDHF